LCNEKIFLNVLIILYEEENYTEFILATVIASHRDITKKNADYILFHFS
jgi:hypothetical protein